MEGQQGLGEEKILEGFKQKRFNIYMFFKNRELWLLC